MIDVDVDFEDDDVLGKLFCLGLVMLICDFYVDLESDECWYCVDINLVLEFFDKVWDNFYWFYVDKLLLKEG